jgi:hypothetical protein
MCVFLNTWVNCIADGVDASLPVRPLGGGPDAAGFQMQRKCGSTVISLQIANALAGVIVIHVGVFFFSPTVIM